MSRFITPKDVGQEKFDAAIYGVWKGENYGGIATYYACLLYTSKAAFPQLHCMFFRTD